MTQLPIPGFPEFPNLFFKPRGKPVHSYSLVKKCASMVVSVAFPVVPWVTKRTYFIAGHTSVLTVAASLENAGKSALIVVTVAKLADVVSKEACMTMLTRIVLPALAPLVVFAQNPVSLTELIVKTRLTTVLPVPATAVPDGKIVSTLPWFAAKALDEMQMSKAANVSVFLSMDFPCVCFVV